MASGPKPRPSWPDIDGPLAVVTGRRAAGGWTLLRQYQARLFDAAFVTIALSVTSMPLAMALGLLIAVGRLYGPRPLRSVLSGYVELIRGHAADAPAFRAVLPAQAASRGLRALPDWPSIIPPMRPRSTGQGCKPFPPVRWKPPWRWACRGRWHSDA